MWRGLWREGVEVRHAGRREVSKLSRGCRRDVRGLSAVVP
jgi:hypothetical protein